MRILYICNEYPPAPYGGIGTFVQTLGRELVRLGHKVYVIGFDISIQQDTFEIDEGINVLRMPLPKSPRLRLGRYDLDSAQLLSRMYLSKRVNEWVVEHGIDLVESYDWNGPLWSAPECPLIVRMHGANTAHAYFEGKKLSRIISFFERRNLFMADYLVAVSNHMRETTIKAFGIVNHACELIYNGIDTDVFKPSDTAPIENRVVFVGKIHPRKGVRELFNAWEQVLRQIPSAKLCVVGSAPPKAELMRYVPDSELDIETIEFTGHIPHQQLPDWYRSASVCVFPSKAEAFGLTCVEAMSCGCAVVMTSLASGPELIQHEENGLLINPSDTVEFADAIIRLLKDRELRTRLGENAHKRVLQMFDKATLVEENVALYRRAIEGGAVRR